MMLELARMERKISNRTGKPYLRGLFGSMTILVFPDETGGFRLCVDVGNGSAGHRDGSRRGAPGRFGRPAPTGTDYWQNIADAFTDGSEGEDEEEHDGDRIYRHPAKVSDMDDTIDF